MKPIIRFIPFLISVAILNVIVVRAQPSPATNKAPATIAGRVTLDGAGAQGAHVMLKPYDRYGVLKIGLAVEQGPALSAVTDAEGRYRITDVPPGDYQISVFAPAYAVEGEKIPLMPGRGYRLVEGDILEGIDFALTRGAVITGKVTDEKARPVIAAPVNAYKLNSNGKRESFGPILDAIVRWETDDRGLYRIFGLKAGRYLVAAGFESSSGRTSAGYRQTFHPDALDEAQARVVEIGSGEEASNIGIKVAAPVKGYVVTGRVVDAESGEPVPGVTVNYDAVDQRGSVAGGVGANALGEFRFENAPPNSYRAFVINIDTKSGAGTYGGEIKFDLVDSDVSGLEIRTPRVATISGVVAIEGSNDPALRAKLAQFSLIARTESRPVLTGPGLGWNGTISPNGTFKLSNVQPGKARIAVTNSEPPKGFELLRVEHNGVEVQEFNVNPGAQITGVRLVFAYGKGVIAGRVEVRGGTLAAGARMRMSYSPEGVDGANHSIRLVDVDRRGQFVIEDLTQGTYKLYLDVYGPSTAGADSIKLNSVERLVTVAGEGRYDVTLVLDLAEKEKDK